MQTPWYTISNIDKIDSPSLVIYPERIKENIRQLILMAEDVQRIDRPAAAASGAGHRHRFNLQRHPFRPSVSAKESRRRSCRHRLLTKLR